MQLICSTFKFSCSTLNWVVLFLTEPCLASCFAYLINNYFLKFTGFFGDITILFVWLHLSAGGSCTTLIVYLFMKRQAPTKSSVICVHLLLLTVTYNFNNCVLSSSFPKHLDSPEFLLEFKTYSSNISTFVIVLLVNLWQHIYFLNLDFSLVWLEKPRLDVWPQQLKNIKIYCKGVTFF